MPSSGCRPISHDIANNEAAIARMKDDAAKYEKVVKRDKDGNPENALRIDGCPVER